jgi:hypothetical protein
MHEAAVFAVVLAGLIDRSTSTNEDALRLTNVTIHIVRNGRSDLGVEARVSNPNDFAIFNILATCDFKDRRGRFLTSFTLTITDAVQANESRTIRSHNAEGWPDGARTADCISNEALRLPD